jgi:hypothetical protein
MIATKKTALTELRFLILSSKIRLRQGHRNDFGFGRQRFVIRELASANLKMAHFGGSDSPKRIGSRHISRDKCYEDPLSNTFPVALPLNTFTLADVGLSTPRTELFPRQNWFI